MGYEIGNRVWVKYPTYDIDGFGIVKYYNEGNQLYAVEFDYAIPYGHDCSEKTKDEQGLWVEENDILCKVETTRPTPMDIVNEFKATTTLTGDDPFKQQVGGGHYKSMAIQPVEFILANQLGFCEGNAIKYLCRYKQKNGVQDLKKAKHYVEMLISKYDTPEC